MGRAAVVGGRSGEKPFLDGAARLDWTSDRERERETERERAQFPHVREKRDSVAYTRVLQMCSPGRTRQPPPPPPPPSWPYVGWIPGCHPALIPQHVVDRVTTVPAAITGKSIDVFETNIDWLHQLVQAFITNTPCFS